MLEPNKEKWYQKNSVRIIINIILSFLLTVLSAFVPQFTYNWMKIGIICIIIVIASSALVECYYATLDMKRDKVFLNSRKEMDAYALMFTSLILVFKHSAKGLNQIAREIHEQGIVSSSRWSFEDCSLEICKSLYDFLKSIAAEGDNIEVYYNKLVDGKDNMIQMVGYGNKTSQPPSCYLKERNIYDQNAYFDCKMFIKGDPDYMYRLTADEVDKILYYKDREKETGRFTQFFLIPTFCEDRKMVGLLQIFSLKGATLIDSKNADDGERKVRKLIEQVKPFCAMLVMMQKVEKAALALPIKESGETNEK